MLARLDNWTGIVKKDPMSPSREIREATQFIPYISDHLTLAFAPSKYFT